MGAMRALGPGKRLVGDHPFAGLRHIYTARKAADARSVRPTAKARLPGRPRGPGIWIGLATGLAVVAVLMLRRWLRRGDLGLLGEAPTLGIGRVAGEADAHRSGLGETERHHEAQRRDLQRDRVRGERLCPEQPHHEGGGVARTASSDRDRREGLRKLRRRVREAIVRGYAQKAGFANEQVNAAGLNCQEPGTPCRIRSSVRLAQPQKPLPPMRWTVHCSTSRSVDLRRPAKAQRPAHFLKRGRCRCRAGPSPG